MYNIINQINYNLTFYSQTNNSDTRVHQYRVASKAIPQILVLGLHLHNNLCLSRVFILQKSYLDMSQESFVQRYDFYNYLVVPLPLCQEAEFCQASTVTPGAFMTSELRLYPLNLGGGPLLES